MKKSTKQLLALASASMLFLAACGNGTETEEGGTGEEAGSNKLVVYSPNSEGLINATIPAFEEKYDVTVELIQAGTGELFTKLEGEKDSPVADVMFGGGTAQFSINKDLFEEYVSSENDNLIEEYQNTSKLYTSYTLDGSVLVVNKDVLGDIDISSYEDLLNPELKGKISSGDPANSSSAFAQVTNMLLAKGGYEDDKAWEYVEDLYRNVDGKISSSSSNVYKTVADGEMAVGLSYEDPVAKLIEDGANVEIVYPEEGVVFLPASAAVIKDAENMDLAKKFIDFIISQEIQNVLATTTTNRPVREDVDASKSMAKFSDINTIQEDMEYVSEHREEIIKRYSDIFVDIESSK